MADVPTTVFVARRFHTMEPGFPTAEAVAVRDGRILAVGSLATVTGALGDEPYELDETLRDAVVLPGLIDQHLHPLLGATTLAMDVIATEDWVLPDRTFPAARSHDEYVARLRAAEEALDPATTSPDVTPLRRSASPTTSDAGVTQVVPMAFREQSATSPARADRGRPAASSRRSRRSGPW